MSNMNTDKIGNCVSQNKSKYMDKSNISSIFQKILKMKKYILLLILFLLLILPVSSLVKFWNAPGLAKVVIASQAGADIPEKYKKRLKYKIEYFYSKIYRQYIYQFGVNEVLEDGALSISFLPIVYNLDNNIYRESATNLFEKLLELGSNINAMGYYDSLVNNNKITVLHDAVLIGNEDLVRYLLTQGADPLITAQMPGHRLDNMNSVELAKYITEKQKTKSRSNILVMLQKQI